MQCNNPNLNTPGRSCQTKSELEYANPVPNTPGRSYQIVIFLFRQGRQYHKIMNSYFRPETIYMREFPGGKFVRIDNVQKVKKPIVPRKPVDLPKLREAILTSKHHTIKVLKRSKDETKTLQALWDAGWRPSSGALRVLDSNINPYIR